MKNFNDLSPEDRYAWFIRHRVELFEVYEEAIACKYNEKQLIEEYNKILNKDGLYIEE